MASKFQHISGSLHLGVQTNTGFYKTESGRNSVFFLVSFRTRAAPFHPEGWRPLPRYTRVSCFFFFFFFSFFVLRLRFVDTDYFGPGTSPTFFVTLSLVPGPRLRQRHKFKFKFKCKFKPSLLDASTYQDSDYSYYLPTIAQLFY